MHEFELGVHKSTFTHLIRMLVAIGADSVQELNRRCVNQVYASSFALSDVALLTRFRHVPTFGRSTIRRFSSNASAMTKLAARDFEDLLQTSMPCFEGLFKNAGHDKTMQELLFTLAEWHALAKLRLHTDSTVQSLRTSTTMLGAKLRHLVNNICPHYHTKELPGEEAARGRRRAAKSAKVTNQPVTQVGTAVSTQNRVQGPKRKLLNLCTYKLHALGDYVSQILWFGTTDSYSTQTVGVSTICLVVTYSCEICRVSSNIAA